MRSPLAWSNGGRKPWFRNGNSSRFAGDYAGFHSATRSDHAGLMSAGAMAAPVIIHHSGQSIERPIDRRKEFAMNKDQAAGGWKEIKGKIKQQWGKLTDDDLSVLEGSADELSGRIQKRYGIAKEEAEEQVKSFRETNRDLISRW
jgi:uncharacterized protein YjbJ (UPF0337 family)